MLVHAVEGAARHSGPFTALTAQVKPHPGNPATDVTLNTYQLFLCTKSAVVYVGKVSGVSLENVLRPSEQIAGLDLFIQPFL